VAATTKDPTKFKAVRGLSYPSGKRVEPGKRLPADFPTNALGWLARDGDIEQAKERK